MEKIKAVFVFSFLIIAACASLDYEDDLDFTVSAYAESPEFPVRINGKECKDTDGILGLCSKRIRSDEPLTITLPARDYSYCFQLECSKAINETQSFHVESGKEFEHIIAPEKFAALKSFICAGLILPDDRPQPLAAIWEVRAKVVSEDYSTREQIYVTERRGKKYLVLGKYARSVNYFDGTTWHHMEKSPVIEVPKDTSKIKAFSESHNMRFNYFGFGND